MSHVNKGSSLRKIYSTKLWYLRTYVPMFAWDACIKIHGSEIIAILTALLYLIMPLLTETIGLYTHTLIHMHNHA